MEPEDRLAPTELLVIEFPRGQVRAEGFATLTELVERGVIGVLDLQFVRRTDEGGVEAVPIEDAVAGSDADLGHLVGAASGLLDEDDLVTVAESIESGSLAGVMLFEHIWILPMVDAISRGGARVVTSARVDPAEIVAALDRLESKGV